MPTQDSIVNQMRQALRVSEPTLDTSIGSPVRSILDAVSEVVAEQTADQYLLNYQYDINSKSGADLDTFVQLFGMARYLAKSSVSYVTFSRGTTSTQDITFGVGAQVATNSNPAVIFTTLIPATIPANATSVVIPVICSNSGTIGNVAAGTITQFVSPFPTITTVTNVAAATGGADAETDDHLRSRFKSTVFRGLAGTTSMFEGIALDNASVTQANVIGSSKTYFDQVQLSSGIGVSSVQDLSYLYPNTQFFGTNITNVSPSFIPRGQYSIASYPQAIPAAPTLVASSGGSLGVTTYYYALVINIVPTGTSTTLSTTLGIVNSKATTSVNKKITVSWPALPTSSAFTATMDVYRLVGSTYLRLAAGQTGTSYLDDGTVTPSATATPPVNNTTGAPVITVLTGSTTTALTNISASGSAVTVTPSGGIGNFKTGQIVTISGTTNYNLANVAIASVGATTFTITSTLAATTPTESSGSITVNAIPDGVYQLRFDYLPLASRNDPANNVTNRVDVYVNGDQEIEATQNVVFSSSTLQTFNNTDGITVNAIGSTTPSMNSALFQREDGTNPVVGNYFLPLAFSPISQTATGLQSIGSVVVTAPSGSTGTNVSGGTTGSLYPFNKVYTENVDYWVINEVDQFGKSSKSRAGLEWNNASGTNVPLHQPVANDVLTVDYIYNQVPAQVQQNIDAWRLVTTDVMVHEANYLYLDFYLAVVLTGSTSSSTVFSSIQTAISNYLTNVSFDGIVQRSEILSVVQQITGVQAVRFLTSATSDSTAILYGTGPLNNVLVGTSHYGIQQLNPITGKVMRMFTASDGSVYRATDVFLDDTELAVVNNVYISQMSQAKFGNV